MTSSTRRLGALLEVGLVIILFRGLLELVQSHQPFNVLWLRALAMMLLYAALYFALPVMLIKIERLDAGAQALTMPVLLRSCIIGMLALVVLVPMLYLCEFLTPRPSAHEGVTWARSLLQGFFWLGSIPLVCLVFSRTNGVRHYRLDKSALLTLAAILASGVLLTAATIGQTPVLHAATGIVFACFGEEAFYRGYVQGRLDSAFGKPHSFMGIRFGHGLLIASLLFGLVHIFRGTSGPVPALDWPHGFFTIFAGIAFGLIREKGGGWIASGIAHTIINAI